MPDRPMTPLRHTLSIALIILFVLSLYLLIALPLLQDPVSSPPTPDSSSVSPQTDNVTLQSTHSPVNEADSSAADAPGTAPPVSGSRLLEIFGRVEDSLGQPIEDVLVTEERYFFSARSDASGNYRILLDLPQHRLPILNFLRAGFGGQRIKLEPEQLQQQPLYQLDVVLADSVATLRLSGWVGNDLGVSLEGARVDISALNSTGDNNYYLTVFTDHQGNFVLEGVRASTHYKLTVNLAPEYPVYHDPDLYVGADPRHLGILLKTLKFVNVNGMILNPESAPVADFEIYIKNVTTGVHTRKIVSDSSGFFSLDEFPLGEVSLTTRGAEFYKISGLELSESDYANLVLIVDKGDRYLTGWINDENGIAVKKAMVTLDATISDGAIEYFSYHSSSTDSNGKFSFDNVASGEHRISVYANGFNKLDIQHRFQSQSDQVHLTLTPHY
ncbi:MAG: carboxypeptidase regulatory-like domain-containing protein [Gammaproteobacteria bacterium]|nr:carboxypeptidase regulatory-like domain-containing protein [Gammaproteobacteria bacterium]